MIFVFFLLLCFPNIPPPVNRNRCITRTAELNNHAIINIWIYIIIFIGNLFKVFTLCYARGVFHLENKTRRFLFITENLSSCWRWRNWWFWRWWNLFLIWYWRWWNLWRLWFKSEYWIIMYVHILVCGFMCCGWGCCCGRGGKFVVVVVILGVVLDEVLVVEEYWFAICWMFWGWIAIWGKCCRGLTGLEQLVLIG